MPIVTVPSASLRIHSWLSVYLRSLGTFIVAPRKTLCVACDGPLNQCFAVANERWFDDTRGEPFVAHLYMHRRADGDLRRYARKRDRFCERRRIRAAGRFALTGRRQHFLVRAQH